MAVSNDLLSFVYLRSNFIVRCQNESIVSSSIYAQISDRHIFSENHAIKIDKWRISTAFNHFMNIYNLNNFYHVQIDTTLISDRSEIKIF